MAAGDRNVKITHITIARANPVTYEAAWQYVVQDKVGVDAPVSGSFHAGSFGTAAAWRAMTGAQMEAQVKVDVEASPKTPPRDSVT